MIYKEDLKQSDNKVTATGTLAKDVSAVTESQPQLNRESLAALKAQVQKTIEQAVTDTIGQSIDMESPLMEAGVDSLASSELVNKINDDMGVSLAPTILFDYPTIQDLTEHLVHMLKGPESKTHPTDMVAMVPDQGVSQEVTTTVVSSAIRYPHHTNNNQKFLRVLNDQPELCSVTPLQRWDRMDWYSASGTKIQSVCLLDTGCLTSGPSSQKC